MSNRRQRTKEYYLLDTNVENMFINEYMTMAPGEYVKVYLFALMYADLEEDMPNDAIAKQLGLQEEDILKAWTYWEQMGVVKKLPSSGGDRFDYQIEFLNLKEKLYGKPAYKEKKTPTESRAEDTTASVLSDKEIQNMYASVERIAGKTMSGTEMMEIISWLNEFSATPEMVVFAYSYCTKLKKKNVKYVGAVVKEWVSKGLTDVGSIENYLEETDQRHYLYKRVLKALGFSRNATEQEMRIMDAWFDDMGYSIDRVLDACNKTSGISNPNMNYVNKILKNWKEEEKGSAASQGNGSAKNKGGVSASTVMRYYEYVQRQAQEAAAKRRQEVYESVPRVREIEEDLNGLSMEISKLILLTGDGKSEKIKELKEKTGRLMREKAVLLTENNFEINYMDIRYMCDLCKDTGTSETGERCQCFPERAKEAEIWQKNQNN